MKKKAQKKCKQKANYKSTIGFIYPYEYRDYKTNEIKTSYRGRQERN